MPEHREDRVNRKLLARDGARGTEEDRRITSHTQSSHRDISAQSTETSLANRLYDMDVGGLFVVG